MFVQWNGDRIVWKEFTTRYPIFTYVKRHYTTTEMRRPKPQVRLLDILQKIWKILVLSRQETKTWNKSSGKNRLTKMHWETDQVCGCCQSFFKHTYLMPTFTKHCVNWRTTCVLHSDTRQTIVQQRFYFRQLVSHCRHAFSNKVDQPKHNSVLNSSHRCIKWQSRGKNAET